MVLEIFVEWLPEQLELSGQTQRFVKGGAYSSSRSLKRGSGGHSPPEAVGRVSLFLNSKNYAKNSVVTVLLEFYL